MVANPRLGIIGQGVRLTLKRLGDPLGRTAGAEGPGAGAVEADAPAARPGSHFLVASAVRRGGTGPVDITGHHRSPLLKFSRTLSSDRAREPAPKTAPIMVMVIAHTVGGEDSLVVAASDTECIRLIRRLLSEPPSHS